MAAQRANVPLASMSPGSRHPDLMPAIRESVAAASRPSRKIGRNTSSKGVMQVRFAIHWNQFATRYINDDARNGGPDRHDTLARSEPIALTCERPSLFMAESAFGRVLATGCRRKAICGFRGTGREALLDPPCGLGSQRFRRRDMLRESPSLLVTMAIF